ncbi:MAG TPA: membrane dipeptidase [Rhizobiaceae bacterium]|nr:membrane dipeptidase [Rhizobiaceae bacterium]
MTTSGTPFVFDGLNATMLSREEVEITLKGGVSALNLTVTDVFIDLPALLIELEQNRQRLEAVSDIAMLCTTVADLKQAHASGRLGYVWGQQNSLAVEDDLRHLQTLKRLGIRILQPTYNQINKLGYGAPFKGDADKGITPLGHQWIEEMTRLKLIMDLSHCGHRTASDYLAAVKVPVVISHANAYAVCPSLRNKTDDHIRAVAKTGGLIGGVMWSPAVRHDKRPTMDDFLNHIDHMIKVGGVDHVAWSSDITEGKFPTRERWEKSYGPKGYDPAITGVLGSWYTYEDRMNIDYQSLGHTPRIWDGMKKRGYSQTDIEKVMGGNWLRVMRDVWGE